MLRFSEGEMKTTTRILTIASALIIALGPSNLTIGALAQDGAKEKLDYAMIARIKEEGLNRSQVMDHIIWLSDVYGPRLTGSPTIKQASDWAQKRFKEWGLVNVHEEGWPFGKGWSLERFSANMIEPQVSPLIGYPKSWTPGTPGAGRPPRSCTRRDRLGGRLRQIPRQASRQDRARAAGARSQNAGRAGRPGG